MAGTSEGGRKAARTRGRESLSAAGRKGGKNSHRNRQALKQERERQFQDREKISE